mmetsp:Transcript_11830/g.18161  ORF Transcript_11830/g.18161 Transcript_11830/m.18161 type:complete len:275 (+) Transcript_11830:133-957(+)
MMIKQLVLLQLVSMLFTTLAYTISRHFPVKNRLNLHTAFMTSSSQNNEVVPTIPNVGKDSKRLFLVRHGEVINPGGDRPVFYGSQDVKLSPLGEQEAAAAANYLQRFDIQCVACSPLRRAIFGAEKVLDKQGSKALSDLVVNPGFTELNRGAWCGLTKEEIGEENLSRFDGCDITITPEGGESYPELKVRVLKARDDVLSMVDLGQAAAIVSHLQVTRCMLSESLGIPTESMTSLKVATASISCIDYHENGTQTLHFQSFKPEAGLKQAKDGAN